MPDAGVARRRIFIITIFVAITRALLIPAHAYLNPYRARLAVRNARARTRHSNWRGVAAPVKARIGRICACIITFIIAYATEYARAIQTESASVFCACNSVGAVRKLTFFLYTTPYAACCAS